METKICSTCKTPKSFEQFYKNQGGRFGINSRCKPCHQVATTAWKNSHLDSHLAYRRRYKIENRIKLNAQASARRWSDVDKSRAAERRKSVYATYGITADERDCLFAEQGMRCASCYRTTPGSKKGWHVDHCHKTNKVRGILCHPCNVALGLVDDSIERLEQLIAYMRRQEAITIDVVNPNESAEEHLWELPT